MSSSNSSTTIPNLFTLRGSRGRGLGRGLRRPDDQQQTADPDLAIQQTDRDASEARVSAVRMGYLEDEFAGCFEAGEEGGGGGGGGERRMPIINRGTYMRTTSLDRLVEDFLAGGGARQVVSLGAGTDTRLFRIQAQRTADAPRLVYHEVDFPTVTARKVDAVARDGRLMGAVRALAGLAGRDDRDEGDGDKVVLDRAAGSLYSPGYNLHPVDLRAPPPTLPNLDPHLPTLVICECLLCYIVPSPTALLTHLLTSLLPAPPAPLGMLVYEPLAPASSAFARTMAANLARRAIRLALLPDLPAHLARLRQHGFPHAAAADVAFLWDRWIPDQEKSRVAKLEFLDELEEWRLIAGHYCVVWAWREEEEEEEEGDQTGVFAKWKELPCQERVLE